MPAVNFVVQWPDGQSEECYSPSTVIYEYLVSDREYSLDEFLQLSEQGLKLASKRVKQKFGYFCSASDDQLRTIRKRVKELKRSGSTGNVIVLNMTH